MKVPAAVALVMGDAPERSGGAGRLVLPLDAAGETTTTPNALRTLSAGGRSTCAGVSPSLSPKPSCPAAAASAASAASAHVGGSTRARERSWPSSFVTQHGTGEAPRPLAQTAQGEPTLRTPEARPPDRPSRRPLREPTGARCRRGPHPRRRTRPWTRPATRRWWWRSRSVRSARHGDARGRPGR